MPAYHLPSETERTGVRMSGQDLTLAFLVDQSPAEVFAAINNVRGWWSEEVEGRTDALGAVFKYHYKDVHRSTQMVTGFVPGQRVVWRVIESFIGFVKDKAEWDGTDIVFDIARRNGQTELRFTHVGLVPGVECYDGCAGAWGFYVTESLRSLITTGRSTPNHAGRI